MCFVKVREVRYQIVLHMLRCFAVEEGKVVKDRQNLPKRQREGLLPSLYVREQRRKMSRYKMWFGLNYVVIVFINYFFFSHNNNKTSLGRKRRVEIYPHFTFEVKENKMLCKLCGFTLTSKNTTSFHTLYFSKTKKNSNKISCQNEH